MLQIIKAVVKDREDETSVALLFANQVGVVGKSCVETLCGNGTQTMYYCMQVLATNNLRSYCSLRQDLCVATLYVFVRCWPARHVPVDLLRVDNCVLQLLPTRQSRISWSVRNWNL